MTGDELRTVRTAVGFGSGILLTLLAQLLQGRGARKDRRCEAAREISELARHVFSGEAGKHRAARTERVNRVTSHARFHGSKSIASAADIVRIAFYRNEQPPGNIVGLAELRGAIDLIALLECQPRSQRSHRSTWNYVRESRRLIERSRLDFTRIAQEQMLRKLTGS